MKWPWQKDTEKTRLHAELQTYKDLYTQLATRDLESERNVALEKQCHILGERAKMYDHMMLDLRKLRTTVKEIWPRDLEIAEETGLSLTDLVIWLIREKPGPGMPKAQRAEGSNEVPIVRD
jgi:hypothetical protein